jgi:hypothetical protein
LTIPEIVVECYDLFDPFKYDLWMVHDQTDPDSFISSDEALDEDSEVSLDQLLTDNGCPSTDSSPELDADLTYFLDQAKIGPKAPVITTDQSVFRADHSAVKTGHRAADVVKDDDCGESRPCLCLYSGPHIKREPCSLEQSPLGEWCGSPCRLCPEDSF